MTGSGRLGGGAGLGNRSCLGRELQGFSIVEVTVAIGIFAFCVIAMLGLFAVGMQNTSQTEDRLAGSHTAGVLLETRRLHLTNPAPGPGVLSLADHGLPEINDSVLGSPETSGTAVVTREGLVAAESSPEAEYRLRYRYVVSGGSPGAAGRLVHIHILLEPLRAAGKLKPYEMVSAVRVP